VHVDVFVRVRACVRVRECVCESDTIRNVGLNKSTGEVRG
jgi:hypothetical protein